MKILRKYRISLAIALAIWVVCLIPIPETPLDKYSFVDEWTHFVMYGILTISMLYESRSRETSTHILLIPIGNGLLVELAQAYLTTCRSGDWFDALCNTLGVFVGLLFGAVGVILGPLVGAILFELLAIALHGQINRENIAAAFRAGWGSFIGILVGTVLKLICCGLMVLALIQAIW